MSDGFRILSSSEVHLQLYKLQCHLECLPESLPSSGFHFFQTFVPDPEKVGDFGSVEAAINHALEISLCPGGQQSGPIILKEHGPGILAIVEVLDNYNKKFPKFTIMQKWISDLIAAAKHLGVVSTMIPLKHLDLIILFYTLSGCARHRCC